MTRLTVTLLGEPRVVLAERAIACSSRKSLGVFCYLAHTAQRHARRDVARLFWGGGNEEAARTSLRTALQRLPPELSQCLALERDFIAVAGELQVDTTRLASLAGATDLAALAEAAQLYRGEFLHNFDVEAAPEFEDWVQRERTRLRQIAHESIDRLIARHRERSLREPTAAAPARDVALAVARRWLEAEPAAEGAHRWVMRLLLDAGQHDAARAQYAACQRELAVVAGRQPGAETRELFESIGGMRAPAASHAQPSPSEAAVNAPELAATSFVGRVEELAALENLLADPACRLVTLHALGGMGKSRLAFALANQVAPRFAHGSTWVALDAVAAAEQLPQALAQVLRILLPARGNAADALCAALRAQERLLVLDNFEHLLTDAVGEPVGAAVELVLAILRAAPRVRIVVTSREVLGVQEEWIYEVPGLAYPPAGAPPAHPSGQYPAIDLFVQRARQAYLGFSPQAEAPHVARICALVEGLPLALELAAAWVRTIPCGDLAHNIETEMAALAARHQNRPARQRSLDAVVRTSWSMLARDQQQVLAGLSIFVGGFTQEGADAVAGASLRVLSALVDKALVRRHSDGRLGMHELVRQFAHAQRVAHADAARLIQHRYAGYFAALLERLYALLEGPGELDAEAALTPELPNLLRAAESWFDEDAVENVALPLLRLCMSRGLLRELSAYADRLLANPDAVRPATRAMVLAYRGRVRAMLGEYPTAEEDFDAAMALARAHGLQYPLAYAQVYRVAVAHSLHRFEDSLRQLREFEPLRAALDDPGISMRARFNQAVTLDALGRSAEAERYQREALAFARRIGAPTFMATVQSRLAATVVNQGRLDEAESLLRDALAVFERMGTHQQIGVALNALALVLLLRADPACVAEAAACAARARELYRMIGFVPQEAIVADTHGQALAALGRHEEARASFEHAVRCSGPLGAGEALFHRALMELQVAGPKAAAAFGAQVVKLAREHDLEPLRRRCVLVAAAVALADPVSAAQADRWLQSLLAGSDLEFELRRGAESLQALIPHRAAGDAIPLDAAFAQAAELLAQAPMSTTSST